MENKTFIKYYLDDLVHEIATLFDLVSQENTDFHLFFFLFVRSSLLKNIERGNVKYLTMKSNEMYYELTKNKKYLTGTFHPFYSSAYWAGYILTYYCFLYNHSFKEVSKYIDIEWLIGLYYPYHEADERKTFDLLEDILKERKEVPTNLKIIRTLNNLSQQQLAKESGVELRSIEMYEQRRNDINKAQSITLYKLSKALGCTIEDILEI